MPKSATSREFRQSNFDLAFQTKMRRNFGASILMLAKFREQCDESKRNFAAWDETLLEISCRSDEIACHKNEISLNETKFRLGGAKFPLLERNFVFQELVADYRMQL